MGMEDGPQTNPTVANILGASESLFLSRSYADVTVDQVAVAAIVTKGAVYHHFGSKQALYLAMLHRDLADKRRLHQLAVELDGSCEERLRRLTLDFLSLPRHKRNLIGLVRRDVNIFAPPTREQLVHAYQEALPNLVERIIRDGIRDREIVPADPRLLAWHFVALVEVVLTPYADQRFACNEDKLNHVMSLFLGGCSRDGAGNEQS
jgi:AcrR family transcriptional regulator